MIQDIPDKVERALETLIFACRWLLAPFYLGLALSIILLLVKFIEEFVQIARRAFYTTEAHVIVGVLTLVDLALTGSLLIIVIFSGYENFVSKMDVGHHKDRPEWMGTIDFTALKIKLLSSIVAISAVQLLRQFMSIPDVQDRAAHERDLIWYVAIHLTFVASSVLLALSDRISGGDHAVARPIEPHEVPRSAENAGGERRL